MANQVQIRRSGRPYRQDAVSLAQFPAEISRTSSKNEGDEDSFSVLTAHNVEAQTRGPPLENHPPGVPAKKHEWCTGAKTAKL